MPQDTWFSEFTSTFLGVCFSRLNDTQASSLKTKVWLQGRVAGTHIWEHPKLGVSRGASGAASPEAVTTQPLGSHSAFLPQHSGAEMQAETEIPVISWSPSQVHPLLCCAWASASESFCEDSAHVPSKFVVLTQSSSIILSIIQGWLHMQIDMIPTHIAQFTTFLFSCAWYQTNNPKINELEAWFGGKCIHLLLKSVSIPFRTSTPRIKSLTKTSWQGWQWWYMSVIPARGRLRLEDPYELKASLGYLLSSRHPELHSKTL